MQAKGLSRIGNGAAIALLSIGLFAGLAVTAPQAQAASDGSAAAQLQGWQTNANGKKSYYKAGIKVTGKVKIGKAYYYFNSSGLMKTGTVTSGKYTYYLNSKGVMEAYSHGSAFYKPTGAKMSKTSKSEYKCLISARKVIASITKKSDSKSTKMYKAFKWVNQGYYTIYRKFKHVEGWTATYANDHFVRRKNGYRMGDCVSDPAAFAYLCLAIGYKNPAVGLDYPNVHAHGVCKVNGKWYDPLFAEAKSFSKYYGHAFSSPTALCTLMVPSYKNGYKTCKYSGIKPAAVKDSSSKASGKNGLVKKSGAYYFYVNGKLQKSKWVTANGYTYYFKSNGKAATGSCKVKKGKTKAYYVFDAKGRLLRGSKTRIVKLDGVKYRVTKWGKAASGWDTVSGGKVCYLSNGALAKGPCLVSGKLCVFGNNGIYNAANTKAARKLIVANAPVGNLISLLGKPLKVTVTASCNPLSEEKGAGHDKTYKYANLKVITFIADGSNGDGGEYFTSIW